MHLPEYVYDWRHKQLFYFRFLHPGVLDKGNYSMFAAPRPILPGEPDKQEEAKVD